MIYKKQYVFIIWNEFSTVNKLLAKIIALSHCLNPHLTFRSVAVRPARPPFPADACRRLRPVSDFPPALTADFSRPAFTSHSYSRLSRTAITAGILKPLLRPVFANGFYGRLSRATFRGTIFRSENRPRGRPASRFRRSEALLSQRRAAAVFSPRRDIPLRLLITSASPFLRIRRRSFPPVSEKPSTLA